ncbi:MAG: hypothetical protein ACLTG0_08255 [Oscillibacter sp.]
MADGRRAEEATSGSGNGYAESGRPENGGNERMMWGTARLAVAAIGGGMARGLQEAGEARPKPCVRGVGTNLSGHRRYAAGVADDGVLPGRETPWRSTPGGRMSCWGPSGALTPNGFGWGGLSPDGGGQLAARRAGEDLCCPPSAMQHPANVGNLQPAPISIWLRQCAAG